MDRPISGNIRNNDKRFRELGEARLKLSASLSTPEDWKTKWTEPEHEYPFEWGTCWKQCTTYGVEDYAAEIGFLHDILGFKINAYSAAFSMFTSPDQAFYLSVVPASDTFNATLPDSLDIGFMVKDLSDVAAELERRGVVFSEPVDTPFEGSPMLKAVLRTPNGHPITLWCMPESA